MKNMKIFEIGKVVNFCIQAGFAYNQLWEIMSDTRLFWNCLMVVVMYKTALWIKQAKEGWDFSRSQHIVSYIARLLTISIKTCALCRFCLKVTRKEIQKEIHFSILLKRPLIMETIYLKIIYLLFAIKLLSALAIRIFEYFFDPLIRIYIHLYM